LLFIVSGARFAKQETYLESMAGIILRTQDKFRRYFLNFLLENKGHKYM